MRWLHCFLTASSILLCLSGALFANDSSFSPTATGIEFTINKDISIESESLFLGEDSVTVEYDFYNHTDNEIVVDMAFPLAEFSVTREDMLELPETPKTKDFRIYVNGERHTDIRIKWRAIVNGTDKAALLQKMRISIENPAMRVVNYGNVGHVKCLDYNLSKRNMAVLIREKLASKPGIDDETDCLSPQWEAQATYLWKVKFPPKIKTKVKHRYTQRTGSVIWTPTETDSIQSDSKETGNILAKFGKVPIQSNFYSYVIHTGGNWKGPIKKLKFVAQGPKDSWTWVEAPFPVKRVSDTKLTAALTNYKPISKSEHLKKEKGERSSGAFLHEPWKIHFLYRTKFETPE